MGLRTSSPGRQAGKVSCGTLLLQVNKPQDQRSFAGTRTGFRCGMGDTSRCPRRVLAALDQQRQQQDQRHSRSAAAAARRCAAVTPQHLAQKAEAASRGAGGCQGCGGERARTEWFVTPELSKCARHVKRHPGWLDAASLAKPQAIAWNLACCLLHSRRACLGSITACDVLWWVCDIDANLPCVALASPLCCKLCTWL